MSRRPAAEPHICARDVEFAMATRDELWYRGKCLERIRSHGIARQRGSRIEASDTRDEALTRICGEDIASLREIAQGIADGRVRAVASARRIGSVIVRETTMTISIRHVSIVTSPDLASRDAAFLRELVASEAKMTYRNLPVLWQNGSAAVLLHEAVGHAAEHDAPPVQWPHWLRVSDEPAIPVDDCGDAPRSTDLLSEPPSCVRRESFRDVPLRRMTRLVARQSGAPLEIPEEHIEVQLVAGGGYDALTDTVLVNVSVADLVHDGKRHRLRPFKIREHRAAIAQSLCGAAGEPVRYPGVICSREGQEIVVGSFAPVMMTS
jgi:hypothetical protein